MGSLGPEREWKIARPDYDRSFPRDHRAHRDYLTEWPYFTGRICAGDGQGRRFAYQFTIFKIGIPPQGPALEAGRISTGLFMGHAAIADVQW